MSMSVSGKTKAASADPCATCCKKLNPSEDAICCFLCETWHHIRCVNLSKKHYNFINELGASLEWFCMSCTSNKNSLKNNTQNNTQNNNTNNNFAAASTDRNVEAKIHESIEKLKIGVEESLDKKFESLASNLLDNLSRSCNSKVTPPSSKPTYAAVSRKLLDRRKAIATSTVPVDATPSQVSTPAEKLTLVISGDIDKALLQNTSSINRLLTERFAGVKIVRVNVSPTGLIFVNVHDLDSANRLLSNWPDSLLGSHTKINSYKKKTGVNNSVILRNVDTNLLDSEIINHVKMIFRRLRVQIYFGDKTVISYHYVNSPSMRNNANRRP
jgi:hypothetical protein